VTIAAGALLCRRMIRRLVALCCCALVLAGCRVDVAVDVLMAQNGSGDVRVTVQTDAGVATATPGLATDVRLDDLRAAGWTSDGPTTTADGGLVLVLTRHFDTPEQATAILATLNGPSGPLQAVAVSRDGSKTAITYRISGSVRMDDGLDALADPDLLAAIGASPWADAIAASGATPAEAVSITLRATLPGSAGDTDAEQQAAAAQWNADGDAPATMLSWQVPLDGGRTPANGATTLSLERGGLWGPLAWVLRTLLVVWVVAATGFIVMVARARRRRAHQLY
jgi:hypothetical protein